MGQSATLYAIDKNDFKKIAANPEDSGLIKLARYYEIFDKSFEGLRFLLSKNQNTNISELVDQVFYPKGFVGEEIDYSKLDFDNLPQDFDFEKQPIYYNSPERVLEIANFLNTLSLDFIAAQYDADELNANNIYPNDIWNNHIEENYAFNARHMTEEFRNLKVFFNKAKENDDYVLSFVG